MNEQYCQECRFPCGKQVVLRTSEDLEDNFSEQTESRTFSNRKCSNKILTEIAIYNLNHIKEMKNLIFCRLCGRGYLIKKNKNG